MAFFKKNCIVLSLLSSLIITFLFSCNESATGPDEQAPSKPTNVVAAAGNASATITWEPVAGATLYNIYWATTEGVSRTSTKISSAVSPYKHPGLNNGTTYHYKVSAENSIGESDLSTETQATPDASLRTPEAPINLTVSEANKKLTLTWEPANYASTYNIYWATAPGVTISNTKINSVSSPYEHTGLENGKKYYYIVTAVNGVGESTPSAEINGTPANIIPIPNPPTNVKATAGLKKLTIIWDASANATSYNLYWSDKPNVTDQADKKPNATSPFELIGLAGNKTYYIKISALNNTGESQLSTEASATTISDAQGMALIESKGKSFSMGSENHDPDEMPVHTVNFTYNFHIDKSEVSQKNYSTLMQATYSGYTDPTWDKGSGDNYPVYYINWFDAVLYCNARSKKDNKDTVYTYSSITGKPGNDCSLKDLKINFDKLGYRLPTEAEWEYACKAQDTTDFYWGNNNAGDYAWYKDNSGEKVHEVGKKSSNQFDLYDMCGNVWEWCNDWDGNYNEGTVTDPTGPTGDDAIPNRITRGGNYQGSSSVLRSANRHSYDPNYENGVIGMRTVYRAN